MNAAGTALENSGFTIGQSLLTTSSPTFATINSTARISTAGFMSLVNTTKTTAYTITTAESMVPCDATTAGFSVTLPTAVGNSGQEYVIKKLDSTANIVTVATTSSQTIDGVTTKTLTTQYQTIRVKSNGANWWVV
jgi:hypothetical protein